MLLTMQSVDIKSDVLWGPWTPSFLNIWTFFGKLVCIHLRLAACINGRAPASTFSTGSRDSLKRCSDHFSKLMRIRWLFFFLNHCSPTHTGPLTLLNSPTTNIRDIEKDFSAGSRWDNKRERNLLKNRCLPLVKLRITLQQIKLLI